MRVRSLVACVVLLGAALGAAGCSSSGSSGKAPVAQPTGTVTVKSGNKVICVIKLDKSGTGTCKVSTANYQPGKVTFTGTYSGSAGLKAGSGSTTLTIKPAAN